MTTTDWLLAYAVVFVLFFAAFGMQRATLLISRKAGVHWKGGGELLLPRWYPWTWVVIVGRWCLLLAIGYFWQWGAAAGLWLISWVLTTVLPIPYGMYRGFFQDRVREISQLDPMLGMQLQRMLDDAPF